MTDPTTSAAAATASGPASTSAPITSAPDAGGESAGDGPGEPESSPTADAPRISETDPPESPVTAQQMRPAAKGDQGSGATSTEAATTSGAPAKTIAPYATSNVAADPVAEEALATLAGLRIKGRAPMTNYDRARFGPAWSDTTTVEASRNGCDTRNDILRRDLVAVVTSTTSNGCLVLKGVLHDRYSGATIDFTRGQVTSMAVQIDHVVPLADAWQKGAQQLTTDERENFANDPLNLQAVDGPTNSAKGAGDAATWLPPKKSYRCTYVARQVFVKQRYNLWVTKAEYDAVARVLSQCAKPIKLPKPIPVLDGGTAEPPTNCYPLSNKGNCYEIGQQCASRYRGDRGMDARGREMRCVERDGYWRWEP